MRFLVTGSSGLIGSELLPLLKSEGHTVVPLKRKGDSSSISWDPQSGKIDPSELEGFDCVIHLAGENIAAKRWSSAQKNRLFISRVRDTWLLSQALTRLSQPPQTFITASACGFYGDRGEERLTEASPKGRGFLADLCEKWEGATSCVKQKGIRVVHTRFGVGLSPKGGMLAKLLPIFRLGLGGKIGSGKQILPWIAVQDMARAIYHVATKREIQGPVNLVAPHPLSQGEFAHQLAHALHRPSFLPLPAPLLRVALGEMADELLLTSQNVSPHVLLQTGYTFKYPTFQNFLKSL